MNTYYFIARRLNNSKSFSSIVSTIAIISIALGLATILGAFAILIGFQENIQNKLFSFSGHILVTQRSLNNSYEETPISINTNLYKNYDKISSINHLQAVAQKAGILKTEEEVLGVVFKGVGQDYDWDLFKDNLIEGEFFKLPSKGYSQEIIISKMVADKLRLSLGDSVVMFFVQDPPRLRKLKIKGIYQTGMEEFDEKFILGDINLVRRLNNWADTLAGSYEIYVKDFAQLDSVGAIQVWEAMGYDMGLETITSQGRHLDIFDWLNLLNKNVNIFLVLILIVAGFNMTSILLIMIMERIKMIGILKALGATNWQIRQIFIFKGMFLILKGMGWGNLIGLGFCAVQYYLQIIPLDAENYYMNTVPIEWNWPVILAMNLLVFTIISLILLIPTYIISRIQPVKTIRFD
ncbi:MAG: FtsX-like permease family protein [Microscillaceae bacterium]|nr:FtsX-like permease family protein [Microscillaceae bacterium]